MIYWLPISFSQYNLLSQSSYRDKRFFMPTVFKLQSWRCEKNTRCPLSLVAIFKKSFIVLFNATTESVNYSVFWKKRFCNLTYKKNFVKHIENFPQHLSEKFIGDNLSITDIALKNWDLSIIGIAQGFFEVIDYRYRCSTKRFIVPISAHSQSRLNSFQTVKTLFCIALHGHLDFVFFLGCALFLAGDWPQTTRWAS